MLNLLSAHSQPWVKKVLYAKKYEREAETVTALRHTTVSGFRYQCALHKEPF